MKDWILSLTGAAILTGCALALTPKGRVRGVVQLLCGVVMALTLIRPLPNLDVAALIERAGGGTDTAGELTESFIGSNVLLTRTIIEERASAYILDKAQVQGYELLSVTVTAKCGDDGCYYPYEAEIRGPETAQAELSAIIESELGIPVQRQYWTTEDETRG